MNINPATSNGVSVNLNTVAPSTKKEVTIDNDVALSSVLQPAIVNSNPNPQQTLQELKKTIEAIQGPQRALEISVHKETQAIMIKVKNKETGELIREAPPEKVLDAVAKLMEVSGLIVDKKI